MLCHRWLLERLPALMDALPFCYLAIETKLDRDPERQDLLLDYQPGVGTEVCSHELFRSEILPICSPAYLKALGLKKIDAQTDWSRLRLLHDGPLQGMADYPGWSGCLQGLGGSASFANSLMCIEAARLGLGLALAPRDLVAQDLQAGRLVVPLSMPEAALPAPQIDYLSYRKSALEKPFVRQLLAQLLPA